MDKCEAENGPLDPSIMYYMGTRFKRRRKGTLDPHESQWDDEDSGEEPIPSCDSFIEHRREPTPNTFYEEEVRKPVQAAKKIVH